jgi:hypothetical protein
MALTDGDREWLQGNFDRIHDRINKGESDVHKLRFELAEKIAEQRKQHEDKHHDLAKSWGIIAAIIAGCTGVLELIRWIVKKG